MKSKNKEKLKLITKKPPFNTLFNYNPERQRRRFSKSSKSMRRTIKVKYVSPKKHLPKIPARKSNEIDLLHKEI
jgi:hypothetical protein